MKKINLLILMLLLGVGSLTAQTVSFIYDDAGNRTHRMIVLPEAPPESTQDSANIETEEELAELEKNFEFESLAGANIKVFPNPVKGQLKIRLENFSNIEGTTAQLYNASGRVLETKKLQDSYSSFNMKGYSPGMYILRIIKNNESKEYKIIKK